MFSLKVIDGLSVGVEFGLRRGGAVTVGRGAGADAVLEDPLCSAQHFKIEWTSTGMILSDVGSLNGVFLNGERVRGPRKVKRGDFIQAGGTLLELVAGAAQAEVKVSDRSPTVTAAATMMMDAAAVQDAIARTRAQAQVKAKELNRPAAQTQVVTRDQLEKLMTDQPMSRARTMMLEALPQEILAARSGGGLAILRSLIERVAPDNPTVCVSKKGGALTPHARTVVSIGRDARNDIPLVSDDVSGTHARITRDGAGRFELADEGSTNGTFLNGRRIVRQHLADGDVVQVGMWRGNVALHHGRLALEWTREGITSADGQGTIKVLKAHDTGAHEWDPLLRERVSSLAMGGASDRVQQHKKKKKGKSADDIAWRATSDVQRSRLRRRLAWAGLLTSPAVLAVLFLGHLALSNSGAGSVLDPLSPGAVAHVHADARFAARHDEVRASRGQEGAAPTCFACHTASNAPVADTACAGCHAQTPTSRHAVHGLDCFDCHGEHNGRTFSATAQARVGCVGCHIGDPHDALAHRQSDRARAGAQAAPLTQAQLDVDIHDVHAKHLQIEGRCVACHALNDDVRPPADAAARKAFAQEARRTCGVCHAPSSPAANTCVQCHAQHASGSAVDVFVAAKPVEAREAALARLEPGTLPMVLLLTLGMALPVVLALVVRTKAPAGEDEFVLEAASEQKPAAGPPSSAMPAPPAPPPSPSTAPPIAAPPVQAPSPVAAPPAPPPPSPPPSPPPPPAPSRPPSPAVEAAGGAATLVGTMAAIGDEQLRVLEREHRSREGAPIEGAAPPKEPGASES